MAREIKLTNGGVAIVDDEDFSFFSHWRWNRAENKGRTYAVKCFWVRGENRRVTYRMDHFLMVGHDGDQIDHIDGSGLNNQKLNLRPATFAQNQQNSKVRTDNTTGYRNVSKVRGMLYAQVQANKIHRWMGAWDTPEQAAYAADVAMSLLHGEFARPNNPVLSDAAKIEIRQYVNLKLLCLAQGRRMPSRNRALGVIRALGLK